MYRNLHLIYGQSEEAEQWRAQKRESWERAAEDERQEIEYAKRQYEQRELEELDYRLDCALWNYLHDDSPDAEEVAQWELYHCGVNPDQLEQLALDMIDTL